MTEWRDLTIGEEVARGVRPPGPLAPFVASTDPAKNEQTVRDGINPEPRLLNPFQLTKGFRGPGLLSNLGTMAANALQGKVGFTPSEAEAAYKGSTPTMETAANLASVAIPAPAGPLGRMALGGVLGGAISGESEPLTAAAKGAGLQGVAEAAFVPAKYAANKAAAALAESKYGKALEAQAAQHAEAVKGHVANAVKSITEYFKQRVPALASFASDEKGLSEMVYGSGPKKVSRAFDKSLEAVKAKGAGMEVPIPAKAARDLGVGGIAEGAVGAKKAEDDLQLVRVDAADLAEAMTGKWKKNPLAYRQAADALDNAGIGDPIARQQFKTAQGLFDYVDKTKALSDKGLDVEKLVGGMYQKRTIDLLRKREIGDVVEGPFQAARGTPEPPSPLTPPDIGRYQIPGSPTTRGRVGAVLGAMLGGGGFNPVHMGVGGGAGYLTGHLIPNEIITRAPIPPEILQMLKDKPSLLGAFLRNIYEQSASQP